MKAFPSIESPLESKNNRIFPISAGMDLRDYFAAKAMQAMLSWEDVGDFNVSEEAYMMADAMMEARGK